MRATHRFQHGDRNRRKARRVLCTLAGASLLGTLVVTSPATAQEVEPGKGDAYAQGIKVDPQMGQLSFGITYGQALAGHQNSQAIAEARSIDLGVIGTTLAGEGCDGGDPTLPAENQPQPLVSRTDEGGGAASLWELTVERSVNSSNQPFATSTAVAAGVGQPGVAVIGAATSTATSGVIDGRRVARATTDIASIGIPGILEISGLHWEVEYQTAPEEKTVTNFSIDGLRVANTKLIQDLLDLVGGLTADLNLPVLKDIKNPLKSLEFVNELLTPLGISINAPKSYVESGIAFVDPLRISIAPRNQTVGDLISLIQPVREAITESLIAIDCGNATYITVADLAVGSVTGAGALNLELGGVTATTGEVDIFEFEIPDLGAVPPVPATPPASFDTGSSSAPSTPIGTTAPSVDTDEQEVASPVTEPVVSSSPLGVRGGAMLGVGLGVLALLAALAEMDRRKMRKAQRSVPMLATTSDGVGDVSS